MRKIQKNKPHQLFDGTGVLILFNTILILINRFINGK